MASAVRRGLERPLLIGDMPFGSCESSNEQAIENAQRFVKEAGCEAVKLERGGLGGPRPRDRSRRDPGDGPCGSHAADRDRPGRVQGARDGRRRPRRS